MSVLCSIHLSITCFILFCAFQIFQTTLCGCGPTSTASGTGTTATSRHSFATKCLACPTCQHTCRYWHSSKVPMQPQGQPPLASGIHAQRPPHPNLFQEALTEHAASVAANASRQIQPGPSHAAIWQSGFGALHTLSSSQSSTTSGSSSSSGGSGSSVSSTDVPIRPTYQSMGPHPNIAFDLYV